MRTTRLLFPGLLSVLRFGTHGTSLEAEAEGRFMRGPSLLERVGLGISDEIGRSATSRHPV